jgi:heparan-alpha-glucosaminide N-acetyltransferase
MATPQILHSGTKDRMGTGTGPALRRVPGRVVSIDIFRGLTMMVMIFVNQLGEMKGLPGWTYHMPASANGMTYVDVVFPFFLFIVGMSVPLAIRRRLSEGESEMVMCLHVVARSLSLIILGLILANRDKADAQLTGMNTNLWTFLALLGALLFWNRYPDSQRYKVVFRSLKLAGVILLAAMLAIFRRLNSNGQVAWLDTGYWEILGMIGWTYFNVCLLYIPTRRWPRAQFAWLGALTALNILCCVHWITWAYRAPFYLWPFKSGALSSIIMAGLITSLLFLTDDFTANSTKKTIATLCFAAALFALGLLTVPLGISKVRATPTWCLVSSGAAICAFLFLYWVCDVRKHVRWARFIRPGGSNTLLTYILPPLCAAALGREVFSLRWDYGWFALAQAILFTAGILALAALLTRWKVRVQL